MSSELPALLQRLISLEADVLYQEYPTSEEPELAYSAGRIPLLVSAPHGAAHTRKGRYKGEDEYTAGLARLLAEETGAYCIYTRRRLRDDPNADRESSYKEAVRQVCTRENIKFFLDLHGMRIKHNAGLELGTRDGKSCPNQIELILRRLAESGFTPETPQPLLRLRVDMYYRGNGSPTREPMVRFVSEQLCIPAAQFEINGWNRIVVRRNDAAENDKSFCGNPSMIAQTIKAFIRLIDALYKSL